MLASSMWSSPPSRPAAGSSHVAGAERASAHEGRRAEGSDNPEAGVSRDAPGMIRTCDLCLRRAALYPLSYGREEPKSSCLTVRSPSRRVASVGTSTRT